VPRRHTRQLPLLAVACLALVLALGTVTAASGAGLTRAAVKKIATKAATKVLDKRASSLSVGHAASADKVGGATADQLRTTGYRYDLPVQAAASERSYAFPGLPPGTYLATYSFSADTSAPTTSMGCLLTPSGGAPSVAGSASVPGSVVRASASAIVTVGTGAHLSCSSSPGTFTISNTVPSLVSFVRVDTVVPGTATGT